MTSPITTQLPPVPSAQIFSDKNGVLTQAAQQWLVNLRDKVNQINSVVVAISNASTPIGAFNTLSPLTTNGDLLTYSGGSNIRLPIGTNGQVLTVVSGVPTWVTGGGSSPLTTKGDLYGYSTANARIPVGTDGQVLTARSSNALGVGWETPSSGGAILPPDSISGLIHWWNPTATSFTHGGTQVTVNGNPVDTWIDQVSLGGINFTQATSANQPTLYTAGAGGYSGLLFNGTSQFMSTALISLTGFTVYIVMTAVNSASTGIVLEQSVNSNTNDGFYIYIPNNSTVNYRRTVADTYNFPTSWSNGGIYNHIIINLGGISRKNYPMLDGLSQSTTGGTTNNLTVTAVNDNLYLMSRAGTTNFLNGIVMEIVIYNRCLSLGERIGLLSYGQNKYGV